MGRIFIILIVLVFLVREMLAEGSSQRHVDYLEATADSEYRLLLPYRFLYHGNMEFILSKVIDPAFGNLFLSVH